MYLFRTMLITVSNPLRAHVLSENSTAAFECLTKAKPFISPFNTKFTLCFFGVFSKQFGFHLITQTNENQAILILVVGIPYIVVEVKQTVLKTQSPMKNVFLKRWNYVS